MIEKRKDIEVYNDVEELKNALTGNEELDAFMKEMQNAEKRREEVVF